MIIHIVCFGLLIHHFFMSENLDPIRHRPVHLPSVSNGNRSIIQFVTVCTQDRRPVLATSDAHELLFQLWSDDSVYRVGRYVIMPDHVHLFCSPNSYPEESLVRWDKYWKSRCAAQLTDISGKKLWQRDFWDRQLRVGESYSEKWAYIANNPVRAGLSVAADTWPYSGEIHALTWHD